MANKLKVIAEIIPGGDDFYVVTSDNVGVGNQSLTAAIAAGGAETNKKADKTYVDTELAKKANATETEQALGNKADVSELEAVSDRVTANTTNIATQTARIDNIANLPEGSTTGDAELIDIRVGTDGKTYDSAGTAVRTQISDVKNDLTQTNDAMFFALGSETVESAEIPNVIVDPVNKQLVSYAGYKAFKIKLKLNSEYFIKTTSGCFAGYSDTDYTGEVINFDYCFQTTEKSKRIETSDSSYVYIYISAPTDNVVSVERIAKIDRTVDVELSDIRVGVDGTIYDDAGTAVRTQISDVKSDLTQTNDAMFFALGSETVESAEIPNVIVDPVNKQLVSYAGYKAFKIKLKLNSEYFIKTTSGCFAGYSDTDYTGEVINFDYCFQTTEKSKRIETSDSSYVYLYISAPTDNVVAVERIAKVERNETKNVEYIDISSYGFNRNVYSESGKVDILNTTTYLTTSRLIEIKKGTKFKICVADGWRVNVNYHATESSDTRSSYEVTSKSSVYYAKEDYMRLVFCRLNDSGFATDITAFNSPEGYLYVVNNGIIDAKDFGAKYDGVTDCTSAFQICLNYGELIINDNGVGLCSTIGISQDNTIIRLNDEFTIKLKNGTNAPMVITSGCVYPNNDIFRDVKLNNVNISGGIWDGNGNNQSLTPTGFTANHSEWHWWSMIMLLDVDNLTFTNVTMKNPLKFGAMIGNCNRFTIRDIYCDYYSRNDWSMDGLHFGGPIRDGLIDNVFGQTHDDMIGINVDGDYNEVKADMPRRGSAKHITIRNIKPDNSYRAIRLLCGTEFDCDDILIDGVQGTVNYYSAIHISNWAENAKYKNITIRNVNVKSPECAIQVGENVDWRQEYTEVENLIVDGIVVDPSSDNTDSIIKAYNNAKVKNLSLNNVYIGNAHNVKTPLINAHVENAMVSNLNIKQNTTLFNNVDNVVVSNTFLNGSTLYSNSPTNHSESNVIS